MGTRNYVPPSRRQRRSSGSFTQSSTAQPKKYRTVKIQDENGGINFVRTDAPDEVISMLSKSIKDNYTQISFIHLFQMLTNAIRSVGYHFEVIALQSSITV